MDEKNDIIARNTNQKLADTYKELMEIVEKAMDKYKITRKIPLVDIKTKEIVGYETDPKKVDEHIKRCEEEITYYKNRIEETKKKNRPINQGMDDDALLATVGGDI